MKEAVLHSENDLAEQFRLEEFLPYGLSVASDGVSRMIARHYLGQFGLGMPEWRLLAVVGRHGVLSPTEAGDRDLNGQSKGQPSSRKSLSGEDCSGSRETPMTGGDG